MYKIWGPYFSNFLISSSCLHFFYSRTYFLPFFFSFAVIYFKHHCSIFFSCQSFFSQVTLNKFFSALENRLLNSFLFKSNHLNWNPFPVELSMSSLSLTPFLCKYSRSPSSYNPCLVSCPSPQLRISEKFMSGHTASTFHNNLRISAQLAIAGTRTHHVKKYHTQHRLFL